MNNPAGTTTREQVDASVWGTGFGAKRHLVGEVVVTTTTRRGVTADTMTVHAACSGPDKTSPTTLARFDAVTTATFQGDKSDREQVLDRPACARCAKLLAARTCAWCYKPVDPAAAPSDGSACTGTQTLAPDPYAADVHDDPTPVMLCPGSRYECGRDI